MLSDRQTGEERHKREIDADKGKEGRREGHGDRERMNEEGLMLTGGRVTDEQRRELQSGTSGGGGRQRKNREGETEGGTEGREVGKREKTKGMERRKGRRGKEV